MHGGKLWERHPGVRTGSDLSLGERAADHLKAAFGSWAFLIILNSFIVAWCIGNATGILRFDAYPFIALNLVLSWLAAQQGGALQIAANRGDRINAEVALHTQANTDELKAQSARLLVLQERQMELLAGLGQVSAALAGVTDDVRRLRALQEPTQPHPIPGEDGAQ